MTRRSASSRALGESTREEKDEEEEVVVVVDSTALATVGWSGFRHHPKLSKEEVPDGGAAPAIAASITHRLEAHLISKSYRSILAKAPPSSIKLTQKSTAFRSGILLVLLRRWISTRCCL